MLIRRLNLFFLLLLLVVTVAGYVKFGELRVYEQWTTNAQKSRMVLRQVFHDLALREKQALRQAVQIAADPELADLLTREQDPRRGHDAAAEILKKRTADLKADFIWVANAQGLVIARSDDAQNFADGIEALPLAASALRGDAHGTFTIFANKYAWVAAAPALDPRGKPQGLCLVGSYLNPEWLKTVATTEDVNIVLFGEDKVESSTGSSDMGFAALLKQPEAKPLWDGLVLTKQIPYKESTVEAAALLFGDELAARKVGLAVLVENQLPDYLQPAIAIVDPFLHTWYAVIGVLFLFGILFSLATHWGIKREAKKVAKKILDMTLGVPGVTLKAGSYMSEFEPLVKMLLGQLPSLNQTRPLKTLSETSTNVLNELLQDNRKTPDPTAAPLPGQNAMGPGASADTSIRPMTSLGADARGTPAQAQPSPMPGFMPGSSVLPPKDFATPQPQAGTPLPPTRPAEPSLAQRKDATMPPLPPRKVAPPTPAVPAPQALTPTPVSRVAAQTPPVSRVAAQAVQPQAAAPQPAERAPIRMTMTMATVDPSDSLPDNEEAYLAQVFQDYMALRDKLGETTPSNREKFIFSLRQNSQKLKEKFKCSKVRFTVFEKEGKASVKAAPVR